MILISNQFQIRFGVIFVVVVVFNVKLIILLLILKQMTILGKKIIAKVRINLMFNFLHNSQRL